MNASAEAPRARRFLKKAHRSLGAKLFLLLVVSLAGVFAILGYLNIRLHRLDLESSVTDNAMRVSDVLKRSMGYYMMKNDREGLLHIVQTMANEPGVVSVRIINRSGRITYSSDVKEMNRVVRREAEVCVGCHSGGRPIAQLHRSARLRIYRQGDQRVLGIINPILNAPGCSNADCHAHPPEQHVLGVLDTSLSLGAADRRLTTSTVDMVWYSVFAALAIAMLAGVYVFRLVHAPIRDLHGGTRRLTTGDLGFQINVHSDDELGELAKSFNTMSTELRQAQDEATEWAKTLELRVEQKTAELTRAHDQMYRAEKLASIGKLAAVVAHEINNPLFGILTYAKLIRRWIERGETLQDRQTEMRESLILIESESKRCGDIVRNLLTFARNNPFNPQKTDVNGIIQQCIKLVEHKLELGNISLLLELDRELPRIWGDPAQLEQLFLALIINAVEAMPHEGNLRVATGTKGDAVFIVIRDDGMGIPAEVLPRLFEPFVTTKESGKGVGLGLAISRSIVERHRGTIEVDSTEGAGTTFTITIPLANDSMSEPAAAPAAPQEVSA